MSKRKFILSDQRVNTYGFKVLTSGIDTTDFALNPVMLFDHNSSIILGKWNDVGTDNESMTAVPEFDEADAEALKYSNKVDKGYLNGASIGIIPLKMGKDKDGVNAILKCSLKEVSLTAVPANGNCIAIYSAEGKRLSDEHLTKLFSNHTPISTMKKLQLSVALLALLTLSADASDEAIETRITALANENASLKNKVMTLEGDNKTLSDAATAVQKLNAKELVDAAIKDRKITEADRVEFETLATTNYATAKKALDKMGGVKKLSDKVEEGNQGASKGSPSNRDEWTYDDYASKDPVALEKLSHSDPDKFKQLQNDKVTEVRGTTHIGV